MIDGPGVPNARLISARKAAGLSQQELAQRAGLSQRLVSHIETGAREGSLNSFTQLAKALGCAVSYLVGEQVGQHSQAGGREQVLDDAHSAPGLMALARNADLCELLAIQTEEWETLRSLKVPQSLGPDVYLAILHLVRGALPGR
jgi:transcriptional regulator with XRE-family HTH domain